MPNTREKLIELLINSPGLETLFGGEEEFAKNADWLIANGVTVQEKKRFLLKENGDLIPLDQQWISVKDGLPDSGKYVLLYCSDGLYGEGHYRAYENKWYLSKITYKSIPDVTHWMPLPEPPKGE